MSWLASRIVAQLITDNKKLDEIKNLLETFSFDQRQEILSEEVKGSSLLYIAVLKNKLDLVRYFIEKCGANPNSSGTIKGVKSTCFWRACALNRLLIAQCLLEYGADSESTDCYERSPLFLACLHGNHCTARFLLKKKASVHHTDSEGMSCLMAAVPYPEICRYLLLAGANVNHTAENGENAILIAVRDMQVTTVSILLCAGADPTITNSGGENAVLAAALKSLKLHSEFLSQNTAIVDNLVANALEIISCHQIIQGNRNLAVRFWRHALKVRKMSLITPLYYALTITPESELGPILDLFDDWVTHALVFLEAKFGLRQVYTINLIKNLVYRLGSPEALVAYFEFFINLVCSTIDDVFFRMRLHLEDVTTVFFVKIYLNCERWCVILKLLVVYLKNMNERLCHMKKSKRLANSDQIYECYEIILNVIYIFVNIHPGEVTRIQETVGGIVNLQMCTTRKMTLLHFCLKKETPFAVVEFLLKCGANVNARDYEGSTPVHYALNCFRYSSREVIDSFFKHGFKLDEISEESQCLSCVLQRRKLLSAPHIRLNLQCMAAKVVAKLGVAEKLSMPRTLQILIYSHM